MAKMYIVELNEQEREQLQKLLRKGKLSARKLKRAQILLAADAGQTDDQIAKAVQVHVATVHRIRQRLSKADWNTRLRRTSAPAGK